MFALTCGSFARSAGVNEATSLPFTKTAIAYWEVAVVVVPAAEVITEEAVVVEFPEEQPLAVNRGNVKSRPSDKIYSNILKFVFKTSSPFHWEAPAFPPVPSGHPFDVPRFNTILFQFRR
jgi:hypothetical protein